MREKETVYRCLQCPRACILIQREGFDNFPSQCKDGGVPVFVSLTAFEREGRAAVVGGKRRVTKKRIWRETVAGRL